VVETACSSVHKVGRRSCAESNAVIQLKRPCKLLFMVIKTGQDILTGKVIVR